MTGEPLVLVHANSTPRHVITDAQHVLAQRLPERPVHIRKVKDDGGPSLNDVPLGTPILVLPMALGQQAAIRCAADVRRVSGAVAAVIPGAPGLFPSLVIDTTSFLSSPRELASISPGVVTALAPAARFPRDAETALGWSIAEPDRVDAFLRVAAREATEVGASKLTVVHKANSIKVTDGLLARSCQRHSSDRFTVESLVVDHFAARLVTGPSEFDIVATHELHAIVLLGILKGVTGALLPGHHRLVNHTGTVAYVAGHPWLQPTGQREDDPLWPIHQLVAAITESANDD